MSERDDLTDTYPWAIPTEAQIACLIESGKAMIARHSDGTETNLIPQLVILSTRGSGDVPTLSLFALATEFNEAAEKRLALRRVAQWLASERRVPMVVALTCECWLSEGPADAPHVQPRHDPNRREGLFVFLRDVTGKTVRLARQIVRRDRKNRMWAKGPLEVDPSGELTTPLLDDFYRMFAEEGLAACQRKREGK